MSGKKSKTAKGKAKLKVKFAKAEPGKRKTGSSTSDDAQSSRKKQRTTGTQESEAPPSGMSSHGAVAGQGANPTADAALTADAAAGNAEPGSTRLRNSWGISSKEVPKEAKPTQQAFQRVIRGMCGLLTQHDVLPSAVGKRNHYDKRFENAGDYRTMMRGLVDESRTAVREAVDIATKLVKDAKTVSGPIANDISRITPEHWATVFTMILRAGLQGYFPDVEGPPQSTYNQLHRHLAVSAFQFLSASFGLMALNVNNLYAQNHGLLCDMWDNFVFGTLAQNTKMEMRRPGSLSKSLQNSVAFKARTRLSEARFKTAHRLELRKPIQRMAYIKEAHSDDEQTPQGRRVHEKPGRNPVVTRFFLTELDVKTEEYRARNANRGQRKPEPRKRDEPLLAASEISLVLPSDVPVDFFTPTFYNSLTLKERARYAHTGVAFPLEKYAFAPEHAGWKKMGKTVFMNTYGKEVLSQYNVPSAEEIGALSDSDADDEDEEEEEIDLDDTDSEMEVEEDLDV